MTSWACPGVPTGVGDEGSDVEVQLFLMFEQIP